MVARRLTGTNSRQPSRNIGRPLASGQARPWRIFTRPSGHRSNATNPNPCLPPLRNILCRVPCSTRLLALLLPPGQRPSSCSPLISPIVPPCSRTWTRSASNHLRALRVEQRECDYATSRHRLPLISEDAPAAGSVASLDPRAALSYSNHLALFATPLRAPRGDRKLRREATSARA